MRLLHIGGAFVAMSASLGLVASSGGARAQSTDAANVAPRAPATGIDYVIVNGAVAIDQGHETAARAGRVLKKGEI